MFVFGGLADAVYLNDLYEYDFGKFFFGSVCIASFLCCLLGHQRFAYVPLLPLLCGMSTNTATSGWKKLETKGSLPPPRQFHSAVTCNDRMFVFGGFSGQNLGDFNCFSFGEYIVWRGKRRAFFLNY